MKVLKLVIKNIRKIKDATIEFNKPLILLYGEKMQGKTTFLDAIKILFSAGFPDDLIKHGEKEASIELILENGVISRSFYIDANGNVKGRRLKAIVNNEEQSVEDLKKIFNPFQLNQDLLKELKGVKAKNFFTELFGVDTKELDNSIADLSKKASDLRSELKGFGNPLEGVEKVDMPNLIELQAEKEKICAKLNKQVLQIRSDNKALKDNWKVDNDKHLLDIQKFNKEQRNKDTIIEKAKFLNNDILNLSENEWIDKFIDWSGIKKYINDLPRPKPEKPITNLPEPEYKSETLDIDTSELENINDKISKADADVVKYDNYIKALNRNAEKQNKEKSLQDMTSQIKELRKTKISKLAEYGKEVKGLSFDENGNMNYNGFAYDNLSTSELVNLGSELSKLYPDSLLDLQLLDRAESLGFASSKHAKENISVYIERAEREKTTILATIVGDKPADMPENVGVYIVEDGYLV